MKKCTVDPTLLSTKAEGNASDKRLMAFHPVQCIGTTTSGAIAFSASMVSPINGSKSGPARWNPPRTAWTVRAPVIFFP